MLGDVRKPLRAGVIFDRLRVRRFGIVDVVVRVIVI